MTRVEASGGVAWSRGRVPAVLSTIAKILFVIGQSGSLLSTQELEVYMFFMLVGLLAFPAWIVSYVMSLSQGTGAGSFEVGATELVVTYRGATTIVPLASVRAALLVERASFGSTLTSVDVELEDGDRVTLTPPDGAQARAIVDALGFGARGRRVRSTFVKPTRRLFHPVLGFLAYCVGFGVMAFLASLSLAPPRGSSGAIAWFLAAGPVVAMASYELTKRLVRATAATAGDDGVEVRGAFRTTFVPRREIDGLERRSHALVIRRRGSAPLTIGGVNTDPARLAAFGRCIEERSRPDAAGEDRLALYGRGSGLSIGAWRGEIERRLKQTDYRSAASTADEALAVLGSAHATPDQRVGAALAAKGAGVPPERIRIAAEATADDRVRVALEAVADDEDDAALERAMKRLSR